MAYNYYNPYQSQYMSQMPQQPVQVQAQPSSGLIWVQGEAGAKSYLVAPNTTVMLMDSETQRFYLKSSDASGMPLPLRIFEYKEMSTNTANTAQSSQAIDTSTFATKAELDALKAEMEGILKNIPRQPTKPKKQEVEADG